MDYERAQVEILRRRLVGAPSAIQAVIGPRQTGKSTIVDQALRGFRHLRVSADDWSPDRQTDSRSIHPHARLPGGDRDRSWLIRNWEEARHYAERRGDVVLAIDEIQKISQWSTTVKGLWDRDRREERPLHVVVSGSAPIPMQSGLAESLAGRFDPIPVRHWSFREMEDAFGLDLHRYVYYGGYPGAASRIREPPFWREYVRSSLIEPAIDRDIVDLNRVKRPALLKQLLELGALYSGQVLSLEKIQGQLRGHSDLHTVADYIQLLSVAGLLGRIQLFSRSPARIAAAPAKLIVLNTAIMTALSDYTFESAQADRTFWGRLAESAVGAHLLNTADSILSIRYWRDRHGHEVDFVLTSGKRLVAIEVKSGTGARMTRGMAVFRERYRPERVVRVADDDRGLNVVSLAEFLSRPAGYWFENRR